MPHWFPAQLLEPDSVPFSALHISSFIFSISTSTNRVRKTTVKQMVFSPRDSLTFEKKNCDWKDCGLNSEADWKVNKKLSSISPQVLPRCSRERHRGWNFSVGLLNGSTEASKCAHRTAAMLHCWLTSYLPKCCFIRKVRGREKGWFVNLRVQGWISKCFFYWFLSSFSLKNNTNILSNKKQPCLNSASQHNSCAAASETT